jgi:hypothetical protein
MMTTTRSREVDSMSAKNRQRRQVPGPRATAGRPGRLPLRPLQMPVEEGHVQVPLPAFGKPAAMQRHEAEAYAFLKRVVVDDDGTAECSQRAALALCGFVLGTLELIHQYTLGMTAEQARVACRQKIADQARLTAAQVAMLSDEDTEGDE